MLDGEKFPAAILVQFSSTRFLSWSSPWGSPSWLQPHAQISISAGTLLQPSRAVSTCHLANSDSPWRPQQGTNFLPGPSKSWGMNVLLPSPSFVIFFLKSGQLVSWLRGTFPVFISVRGRRLIAGADCGVNAADYRALIAMMRKRLKSHWALKPFWRVGTTSVESWCLDQQLSLPDGFSTSTEMCWGEG